MHIVDENFSEALVILTRWAQTLDLFIDATMIKDDEAAERLVRVYRHYTDAWGADFNAIERWFALALTAPNRICFLAQPPQDAAYCVVSSGITAAQCTAENARLSATSGEWRLSLGGSRT